MIPLPPIFSPSFLLSFLEVLKGLLSCARGTICNTTCKARISYYLASGSQILAEGGVWAAVSFRTNICMRPWVCFSASQKSNETVCVASIW